MYALFNGVLAIVYRSWWFTAMCAYHAVLALMKLAVVSPEWKKGSGRPVVMRRIGIVMIALAVVVSGIVTVTISESVGRAYNIVVMIAIAAFTFYVVINACVNMVKARKRTGSTILILRNISCAAAVGSILSLERSMLSTFGSSTDRFTYTVEGVSGLAGFLIILGLGISLITASQSHKEPQSP